MMAVIINGDTGIDKITDGSVVQTDLASGVAGTGPAFHATVTGSTSIPNNTNTKIQFNTTLFDTNSNFDTSTNYRFTPTVAGYYQINATVVANVGSGIVQCGIFRNGSQYKVASFDANTNGGGANAAATIYFNGTTDYVEIYMYQNSGSTYNTLSGRQDLYYFSGHLVRAA